MDRTAIANFAAAVEAQRCIEALDRIENGILARAKNQLAEIAIDRPDIGGVADSLIHSITDAIGDSGLRSMKQELQDAIEEWERKAA